MTLPKLNDLGKTVHCKNDVDLEFGLVFFQVGAFVINF